MGSKILVLFLGLYLGFTFLLAAAAVLALQQLSQGADNARRYALLGRLGVEEKALARSAAHQVTLAFLLPLGLGLVHAAVGLSAVNQVITVTGNLDSSSAACPPPPCCWRCTGAITWPPSCPAAAWPCPPPTGSGRSKLRFPFKVHMQTAASMAVCIWAYFFP